MTWSSRFTELLKAHTPATRGAPDQPSPLETREGREPQETTVDGPIPAAPGKEPAQPAPPPGTPSTAEKDAAVKLRGLAAKIESGEVAGEGLLKELQSIVSMLKKPAPSGQ